MSDKHGISRLPVQKLDRPEHYPLWKQVTLSCLRKENCEDAIRAGYIEPNRDSTLQSLLAQGFDPTDLSVSVISARLTHDLDRYHKNKARAAGIIQEMVGIQGLYMLQGHDNPHQMWTALQERFEKSSPMDPGVILYDLATRTMADFDTVDHYCKEYQLAFDRITSMLTRDQSKLTSEGVETILQTFILKNVSDSYAPLVAQIRRDWTNENTSLQNTIVALSQYNVSNDRNTLKSLLTRTHSAVDSSAKRARPNVQEGSCDHPKCVEKGNTSHNKANCYRYHPEKSRWSKARSRLDKQKDQSGSKDTEPQKYES